MTPRLDEVLKRLAGRHELVWVGICDMPAVGAEHCEQDGYDVASGRFVADGATLGPRVLAAYRRAEARRAAEVDEFFATRAVPFVRIAGSGEIRGRLVQLTEAYRNAGR